MLHKDYQMDLSPFAVRTNNTQRHLMIYRFVSVVFAFLLFMFMFFPLYFNFIDFVSSLNIGGVKRWLTLNNNKDPTVSKTSNELFTQSLRQQRQQQQQRILNEAPTVNEMKHDHGGKKIDFLASLPSSSYQQIPQETSISDSSSSEPWWMTSSLAKRLLDPQVALNELKEYKR